MAVLDVGVGRRYATIAAAVAASRDGDTIRVQAGTYMNDFATINTRVTIEAVGGVKIVATGFPPDGKAIFTTNADVTFRGLEITGAAARDNNGAAIRHQAGNLVVEGCYIHDNQDGVLAASNPTGTILITGSEFSHNGTGDGKSHNIYVNKVARLTIRDSYFHDAVVGHEIKSRAANTVVENNRIFSNATGTGSYNIDLPNGGVAAVRGNVIEKGPLARNTAMVHFGGEGAPYTGSSLELSGNTLVADRAGAIGVLNHTDVAVTGGANATYGVPGTNLAVGAASLSATAVLSQRPALDTSSMGPAIVAPTADTPALSAVASPVATSIYTSHGRRSDGFAVSETVEPPAPAAVSASATPATRAMMASDPAQVPAFLAGPHADGAGADAVRLYRAALGRLPDADGLGFWTDRLRDGASLADLAQGFLSSPEFQARFGVPGDAGYVALLYRNVLGREGDAGGAAYWTDALARGAGRQAVLAGFSGSAENKLGTQPLFMPGPH